MHVINTATFNFKKMQKYFIHTNEDKLLSNTGIFRKGSNIKNIKSSLPSNLLF